MAVQIVQGHLELVSAKTKETRTHPKPLVSWASCESVLYGDQWREVLRNPLENRYTLTGIVGSNPTASAN
jgi:hypothetical protein